MRLWARAIRTELEGIYAQDLEGFVDEVGDRGGGGQHLGLVLNFMSKIKRINFCIYGRVGEGKYGEIGWNLG